MSKKVAKDRVEIKNAIEVNQEQIKGHLNELVRQSVEETLNGLLDAEADRLCKAGRYERVADRVDTRAGHYERGLQTQVGEVELKVPKLRTLPFETQIIERYRRRESSVELRFPPETGPFSKRVLWSTTDTWRTRNEGKTVRRRADHWSAEGGRGGHAAA